MNKTLIGIIAFTSGSIAGVLATRQYFKNKYENIANEEIESVKSVFREEQLHYEENNYTDTPVEEQSMYYEVSQEDQDEYKKILKETNYSGYSDNSEEEVQESMRSPTKPYLISFDEFGTFEDWNEVSVTYYADEILVDQDDDIITDAEDQFGYECLKQFENPDCGDAIYVRNELLETDYEIVRDSQSYEDYFGYSSDEGY